MSQNDGLLSSTVEKLRTIYGWNEVATEKPNVLIKFFKKFWNPSAWMIELIVILSWILQRQTDAFVAMVLLFINALISFFQEQRAENAVELLRQKLLTSVRVLRDQLWQILPSRELVPGDLIRVRFGDLTPADVEIIEGMVQADQSALTGESIYVNKGPSDVIYSGSIIQRGEATAVVKATGKNTFFGRTIELVQTAHPKLHLDEIVSQLVRWLLIVVVFAIVLLVAISWFRSSRLIEVLPLMLVLLMSAVPIALPVMFSVSTAIAARDLGKRGVLVTRLSAAEDAATMNILCVDKTGTITKGELKVVAITPFEGGQDEEILTAAVLASNISDQDPIDNAIFKIAEERKISISNYMIEKYIPFSPETRRTEALVLKNNKKTKVTKGSISAILNWMNADVLTSSKFNKEAEAFALQGMRSIAVAESSEDGKFRLLGIIALQDAPRSDSANLIMRLKDLGIRIFMLTGDALPVAQSIATQIGLAKISKGFVNNDQKLKLIDENDGFAEIFPETKLKIIETFQNQGKIVGMTGDGVNDAPSLKKAEVGIAVSTATDAAKAAASVVLTSNGLVGILDLIENGRAVYQRILTWMINKLSRTVFKVGFVISAYLITGRFIISAIAMLLVALMTDFAKIALATDQVRISQKPDDWNINPLALMGVVLGVLMIIEALILFYAGMKYFKISIDSPIIQTYTFLLLLFMAIFSILSIRERKYFWSSCPSISLLTSLILNAFVGVSIAYFGLFDFPILHLRIILLIILGAALFSLILNDFIKSLLLVHFINK